MSSVEEKLYVVDDESLKKLRDLHRRRDEQAYIAGCALLEYRQRETKIITELASKSALRNLRLGALRWEFLVATKQCDRLVQASMTDERVLGEQALRALGLNPEKEELRIDTHSGVVLVLNQGAWEPRAKG